MRGKTVSPQTLAILERHREGLTAPAIAAAVAGEYPEENGADCLVLLKAKTDELTVDPNDQIGATVEEGLFPDESFGSSCTIGSHSVIAVIDMRNGVRRGEAFAALEKGDLLAAIYAGATVKYHRTNQGDR